LYTLIAHTHDNTFLGFVAGNNEDTQNKTPHKKKNKALLYAKLLGYCDTKVSNCAFCIKPIQLEILFQLPASSLKIAS